MKKFQKSRDDQIFLLTTLQNPSLEVPSFSQMVAALEKLVERETAVPEATPPVENLRLDNAVAARSPRSRA